MRSAQPGFHFHVQCFDVMLQEPISINEARLFSMVWVYFSLRFPLPLSCAHAESGKIYKTNRWGGW